jgi:hypothetical protein
MRKPETKEEMKEKENKGRRRQRRINVGGERRETGK